MKKIKLTQGKFALVDDEDFEELNKFKWYTDSHGYAVRNISPNGKRKSLLMHRLIMNTTEGMYTDHIDHDPLNNQKNNLRVCNNAQNQMNRKKRAGITASKFKGVYIWESNGYKYYVARLTNKGKDTSKYFPFTPEGELLAAKAYNDLAQKHFGKFALLN